MTDQISQRIMSCHDLRRLNLKIEKNKQNEERAVKLANKYVTVVNGIISKNSQYQTTSIVNDIHQFNTEQREIKNNRYHNLTEANTIVDTILHIIEWFKDFQSKDFKETKITFKSFDKLIDALQYEKHSRYFICNLIKEPYELIQIEQSVINFNQAFRIATTLNIKVSNEMLMRKWAIFVLSDNNGSFYKIKSHSDSKNLYKDYSDRCFKQGWFMLLRKFCEHNNRLSSYGNYCNILNGILTEHKTMKHLYGIKEFVDLEKTVGDTLMDMYYDVSTEIDDEEFNTFIINFEMKKSTPFKNFKLTEDQIHAIKQAITNKFCNITGPPGTGKSTITECIIEWYNTRLPEKNTRHTEYIISLMAPTGKAYKGLSDKCGNIKIKTICGTLHKCLLNTFPKIAKQVDNDSKEQYSDDSDYDYDYDDLTNVTRSLKRSIGKTNDQNMTETYPQYINKIIVDETSMVDIFMFRKLLKWCTYFNCSLVLCGDIRQLPPVGKGRPYECIINSELFSTCYLREIKRQDAGKLKDCIVNIDKHELSIKDFDNETTIFIEHSFGDESKKNSRKLVSICSELVKSYGKDNIAFITPENGKSCGSFEMNKMLQNDVYNPERTYNHGYFKDQDFVMRTENKYDGDDIRVNGDTGKITFKKGRKVAYIQYDDDPRGLEIEEVPVNEIKDNFTLNYCNTVHKFQGSQKDVVVFLSSSLHSSLSWGTNRLKLAYTAISRAAKTLIILGDKETFFNIQNCKEEPFVTSFMNEFDTFEIASDDEE